VREVNAALALGAPARHHSGKRGVAEGGRLRTRAERDAAMRYMILFKNDMDTEVDVPPCLDLDEMGGLMHELARSGVLLATEGLQPSAKGARVRVTGGKRSVVDGPFTEAKELIAGFALVQVGSKDEAVDLAERFLRVAGFGTAEVREAFDPKPLPAADGAGKEQLAAAG